MQNPFRSAGPAKKPRRSCDVRKSDAKANIFLLVSSPRRDGRRRRRLHGDLSPEGRACQHLASVSRQVQRRGQEDRAAQAARRPSRAQIMEKAQAVATQRCRAGPSTRKSPRHGPHHLNASVPTCSTLAFIPDFANFSCKR